MADNIERKIDQLTQAVKGLATVKQTPQAEIYNTLNALSEKYENFTTVSSEKIVATLVNEFRKSIELKYSETNSQIKELEKNLKDLSTNLSNENPRVINEINRLINETVNSSNKLISQETTLNKILGEVEFLNNSNPSDEINKLTSNFSNFSGGLENLTNTINRSFAEFLAEIKNQDNKEQFNNLKSEIAIISGNINSIISAISIIDTKYRDLSGLVDAVKTRENIFNDALKEVNSLKETINGLKEHINTVNSKEEIYMLNAEMKNQIDGVKHEIQKIINTTFDTSVKTEVNNLSQNIEGLNYNVNNVQDILNGFKGELKEVFGYIENSKSDISLNEMKDTVLGLINTFTSFKDELNSIVVNNIQSIKEPIDETIKISAVDTKQEIEILSEHLKSISVEIRDTIANLQRNLDTLDAKEAIQTMYDLKDIIPAVINNLESFKVSIVEENQTNFSDIKSTLALTVSDIREILLNASSKLENNQDNSSQEAINDLKISLGGLQESLFEEINSFSDKIKKELVDIKTDFSTLINKQAMDLNDIVNKIAPFEQNIENINQGLIEKFSYLINENNKFIENTLKETSGDILDGIDNFKKINKLSVSQFEDKLEKILLNCVGSEAEKLLQKKSLKETVVDIEAKVERTNLQQIHNAKELLEEIQAASAIIQTKIASLEETKTSEGLGGVSDKINAIESHNTELKEELSNIKTKLDETIQKLNLYFGESEDKDNTVNYFEEIKNEFKNLENQVKSLRTSQDNPNYTYTLEDVESDLAKVCYNIEKNTISPDEFKLLSDKTNDIKNFNVETVKLCRDIETEVNHLSGWCKDAINKIDDINERLDEIQNIGFADIKTRIVQSEKSKHDVFEQNNKLENAIKVLIKNARAKDEQIAQLNNKLDLMAQAQAESFNPNQFIDIFYENMTQTKMLSNRVEIVEDKINTIQAAVERLLSYVEN